MWHGGKIYFLSDRETSKRMNLYGMDYVTKETKKLTDFQDFDIKFPSMGDTAVVFEQGGWLWKWDLATAKLDKVPVEIAEDFSAARTALTNVAANLGSGAPSPDGNRVVVAARGELFSIASGPGITRRLTHTPGAHDRNVTWSPDGKQIAFFSDASGEDEIHLVAPDGKSAPVQLTTGGAFISTTSSGRPIPKTFVDRPQISRSHDRPCLQENLRGGCRRQMGGRDASWSPDSKWVAWSEQTLNDMRKVRLKQVETNQVIDVTDAWHSSVNPVFSGDGKFLFLCPIAI